MSKLADLQPQNIWGFFDEILQIPRASKKEQKIIAYIDNFAKQNNLEHIKDSAGNILVKKEASKGMEGSPTVILQGHVDMVCEKNSDVDHNFDNDPIKVSIDNGWVKAEGTTLGADNGIGIAAQLAVLSDKSLKHGPIECLFTVEEEIGLTGAKNLDKDFLSGKKLINLDSEEDGEIFIGCAGGIDTLISYPYKTKSIPIGYTTFTVSISGLKGGHSGDDISKGLGNSNKLLTRFLWELDNSIKVLLADFQGGNLRNAIPREAHCTICVKQKDTVALNSLFNKYLLTIQKEFKVSEPGLVMNIKETGKPRKVLTKKSFQKLINALHACPNGVTSMSLTMPGLVETSTNLASINFSDDNTAEIVTSQRSSVESSKSDIANRIKSLFKLVKANVWHSDSYPGWDPNKDSEILKIAELTYKDLFKETPKVKAIHAGLECGLFLEKYPNLDMISIGPTMRGVHSPDERLEIKSVERFWKFLVGILASITPANL